jgi:uncharacterized protein
MLTEDIKQFIEGIPQAIVATADCSGNPHLALGRGIKVLNGYHLVLENWYCQTTLRNLDQNLQIAIVVMDRDSIIGFQLIGDVVHGYDIASLAGYVSVAEEPGDPRFLTRIIVRVEKIQPFCSSMHTDSPLDG